jgi:ribonuclease P protein component
MGVYYPVVSGSLGFIWSSNHAGKIWLLLFPKVAKKAVVRNHLRRQLSEAIKAFLPEIKSE